MLESVNLVKNRRRNKFFSCFNAGGIADHDHGVPCFCLPSSDHERRKKTAAAAAQKRLSRSLIKAVLRKASIVKKFRDKKHKWELSSCRSSGSNSSSKAQMQTKNPFHEKGTREYSRDSLSSNRSSLFSSTSSSSSSFSNTTLGYEVRINESAPLELRQTTTNTKRMVYGHKYNYNPGMCILMICLAALVLWGKACAIVICTSACLLAGDRRVPAKVQTKDNNVAVVESWEYKKRVIMEGLLERHRSH